VNKKSANSRTQRGRRSKASTSASDASSAFTANSPSDADITPAVDNSVASTDTTVSVSASVTTNAIVSTDADVDTNAIVSTDVPSHTMGDTVATVDVVGVASQSPISTRNEVDDELDDLLAHFEESVARKQAILTSIATHLRQAEEHEANEASFKEVGKNYDLQLQALGTERESLMRKSEVSCKLQYHYCNVDFI
jgi:hypothetical protein